MNKLLSKSTLLFLIIFSLFSFGCSRVPSDKSMIEHFRAKEADFNKLLTMAREDKEIEKFTPEAVYKNTNDGKKDLLKTDIPSERIDEYHRLFQQTGVKGITKQADGGYSFDYWDGRPGLDPIDSAFKYYLYAETPPAPLLDSLEDSSKLPKDDFAYKQISDNWYLAYILLD